MSLHELMGMLLYCRLDGFGSYIMVNINLNYIYFHIIELLVLFPVSLCIENIIWMVLIKVGKSSILEKIL